MHNWPIEKLYRSEENIGDPRICPCIRMQLSVDAGDPVDIDGFSLQVPHVFRSVDWRYNGEHWDMSHGGVVFFMLPQAEFIMQPPSKKKNN